MLGTPEGNLLQQYLDYLSNLARDNFGASSSSFPYTVTCMIGQAIWLTVALASVTQVLGVTTGTLLGAFAAWRRNTVFDSVGSLGLTFLGTLPYFGIAMLLIYFLAFKLNFSVHHCWRAAGKSDCRPDVRLARPAVRKGGKA